MSKDKNSKVKGEDALLDTWKRGKIIQTIHSSVVNYFKGENISTEQEDYLVQNVVSIANEIVRSIKEIINKHISEFEERKKHLD